MPSLTQRALTGFSLAAALCGWSTAAHAQYFGDPCACGQPIAAVPAPIVTGQYISSPVAMAAAACNPCACMQPVAQLQPVTTVQTREVQTVEYVPVQKPQKVITYQTAYEDREVTQYQTVQVPRTATVQQMAYQTVTECRPMTVNQSYWRTAVQPVPKMAACQYDPRPGMLGAFNRLGYDMRMAFTPNYTTRREFVPNVQTFNQPVQRVVAVPTTQQVTYNVAQVVPVKTTQKVAVLKPVETTQMVTVMEPRTTTRTVQVPTTQWAYVDPFGGTATAAAPTPATSAQGSTGTQTTDGGKGTTRLQAVPEQQVPLRYPTYQPQPTPAEPQPTPADTEVRGPVASQPSATPRAVKVVGWKTSRSKASTPSLNGPELPEIKVAQK